MPDINPYASPGGYEGAVLAEVVDGSQSSGGLYRKGNQLVMHKQAFLPDRCVKSSEPAEGLRLQRTLYWFHPLIYIALLISPLIFIILAIVLRKQARIEIGLSQPWFRKRRWAIGIGWTTGLLGVAALVGSIAWLDQPGDRTAWIGALGILFAFVALFFGIIYGTMAARMVAAARIDGDYIWLKGVHPAYLADLPPWPYYP